MDILNFMGPLAQPPRCCTLLYAQEPRVPGHFLWTPGDQWRVPIGQSAMGMDGLQKSCNADLDIQYLKQLFLQCNLSRMEWTIMSVVWTGYYEQCLYPRRVV